MDTLDSLAETKNSIKKEGSAERRHVPIRLGLAMAGATLISYPVHAQDLPAEEPPSFRTVVDKNTGRKEYHLLIPLTIEARVQKPNAFYVLERGSLVWNYTQSDLERSFLPKMIDSVKESPF